MVLLKQVRSVLSCCFRAARVHVAAWCHHDDHSSLWEPFMAPGACLATWPCRTDNPSYPYSHSWPDALQMVVVT
jgi:hypothetical protein